MAAVEAKGVLPPDTLFYRELLSLDQTPLRERRMKRQIWLSDGLGQVEAADIVFYDPDNGLEISSRSRTDGKGPKHVFYDELASCWERGQSIVVYHHTDRSGNASDQVKRRIQDLRQHLEAVSPMAIRFRRRSSRVYFVLPQPYHYERLQARAVAFLRSGWGSGDSPHFEMVEY